MANLSSLTSFIPEMQVFLIIWLLLLTNHPSNATISQDFMIEENKPVGTQIGKLLGQGPYIVFDSTQVSADFEIDQTTGWITTRTVLDRERRDMYSFGAVPNNQNSGNEPLKVTIRVSDINDNSPKFEKSTLRVTMSENAPKDTKPSLGSATDRDIGQNTTQSYEITSGNVGNAFRLAWRRASNNMLYCDLLVNGVLDYETRKQYDLEVTAYDGGSPRLSGSMQVIVDILDSNDNQPIFNTSRYSSRVLENATIGTSVARVFATDLDTGVNGQIRYYIDRTRSDAGLVFGIDELSGVIKLNKQLDYETKNNYELIVVARDSGAQPLETTAIVSVHVGDVNDHEPDIDMIFLTDEGLPRLPEDAEPGFFLARISVSDKDKESFTPQVNVTLLGGDGHFALTSRDNIVYLVIVSNPVDREMKPFYDLTVVAKDSGSPPLTTNRTFTVKVLDTNDNKPQFSKPQYHTSVQETALPGSSVLQVRATDLDTGNNSKISYSISANALNHSDWFQIDEASGLITTRTALDCETHSEPHLVVKAVDHGVPVLESQAVVVVSIRDENDNHPVFDQSFYTVSIPEDKAPGSCVLKVSATDPDCGVNAQVTYTLPDNLPADIRTQFEIRNATGDICIIRALDYETKPQYEFTVIAKDGDGLQSSSIVKIVLTNVNDHLPIFYPDHYSVNLVPDAATGTEVAAVRATDADRQGALTYRISSGNAQNLFSIDQNTGVIRLVSPLTAGVSVYDLVVQAADNDNFMSRNTARVQISIIETSQAPPVFTRSLYTFSVAENAAASDELETVRADNSDTSLGAITYSIIAGDQNGYIAINRQTGVLSVQKTLDREQQSSLLLSIQAGSGNPPRFNQAQANITITDVNDNSPVFSSRALDLVVKENVKVDSAIYQVHATDLDSGDNGRITYSITSSPQSVFSLDSQTGLLTLQRLLDYELQKQYQLTVQARDNGSPTPRSSSQTLRIKVEDVNDNTPKFQQGAYMYSIAEATPVNSKFGVVTASDKDSGNNAKLMYSLEPESPIFGIFPNDGNLYVKKTLDREGQHQYVFNVLVRDNGTPRRSARVPVTITVADINDHDPVFEKTSYEFSISENLQPGHVVGSVRATDKDSGSNAEIVYSLNMASTEFAISSQGRIRTLARLDREKQGRYTLGVVARDQGTRPRSAVVNVVIDVSDVNDHAPEWLTLSGGEVAENSPLGTRVMQLSARDEDVGKNGNVTYAMEVNADSAPFRVDVTTGWLTTLQILDYEQKQSYMLTLIARDQGDPQRQTLQTIIVKVTDVDEGSTDHPTENLTLHVSEDIVVGTKIGDLTLSQTSATSVTYFMTSGNDLANFEVNMISGALYVVRPLDHELQKEFDLEIKAKNSHALFSRSTTIYVRVVVTDVNDNRPTFTDDPILLTVKENTKLGTQVYQFQATDPDSSSNGTVRYRIISTAPPGDYFQLNPDSGKLTTKVVLDYELMKQISLVVEAEDQAPLGSRKHSRVTAHVFVRDVNDHVPVFRSTSLMELAENERVDYPILHVIADDRDSGDAGRVTYTITTGNVDGTFTLNANTGLLTLARRLDRAQSLHTLNISAQDHGTPVLAAWQRVQIKVVRVEENPPVFDKAQYLAVVKENKPSGQTLVTVRATDADSNAGSVITYSLAGGADKFTINRQSGVITTTKPLDREQRDSYTITAYASSSLMPELVASVSITVTVQDVNDHKPSFVVSTYTISIPENVAYQGFYTVTAVDLDVGQNGQVRYFITDGDPDNKFIIGLTSGELSCDALDAETKQRYNLTITAQDMSVVGALSGTMSLIVLVTDLNDNDPVFSKAAYQASIAENIEVDKSVVTVSAEDRDQGANGNVLHSLGPGTRGAFKIDAGSGEIRTTRSFDREKLSSYRFDVLATDGGLDRPRTVRVPVTITVTDVNDSPPVFVKIPYTASLQLNHPSGGQIVQVSASDQDLGQNGLVTYTLTSVSAYFTVDGTSGDVRTKRLLDNSAIGYHTLVVMATDQGTPTLSSQGFVKIRVGNPIGVADLEFTESMYNKTLNENSPRETPVVQVQARFTDTMSSAGITYSIVSGNDEQAYSVDRNTGWVRVNDQRGVDYESYQSRRLVVMAEGGGATSYASVWLRLQDRNDNPPTFTQLHYVSSVMEGVAADTLVTEVTATDLDEGRNGEIRYYIINGNRDDSFYLPDDTSGVIKTKSVLDREILNVYTLEIEATDMADSPLSSTCTVRISVVDANDNSPFFPTPRPISVPESTRVGSTLTQVTANDVDVSPALIYSFQENGNLGKLFGLDHFSGKISLIKPLDYETQRSYTVELEATDGIRKAYTSLSVHVRDENDNVPRFTQDSYQASLSASAQLGQPILTVHAQDADSSDNARISYTIVNTTYPGLFLDSNSGTISTMTLVAPSLTSINLVVQARDDGTPRLSSTAAVRILVKDGEGPAPAFQNAVYKASIQENSPSGSAVITASASSDDQQNQARLYYSIISGDVDHVFTIVRHTGEIVLLRDLDREQTASYQLKVKVKDAQQPTPRSATAIVQILVTDVNDCVPEFDQQTYTRTLVESLETRSRILQVFAHDPDSGSHAQVDYTITSGNDQSQFAVDRNTGWLSLVKPLDRENKGYHQLIIRAQDCYLCSQQYPLASYAMVVINVTDIDEHDPVFPGDTVLYKFVKENAEVGTVVFTAHALDKDKSAVLHYTLIEGGDNFRIDSTSGRVSTRRQFDYEQKNVYPIRMRVRDERSGSPEADREQRVEVRVVDVDEYAPVFAKAEYEFSVRGDAQPGDVLGRVQANDGDGGEAGSVFYSLQQPNPYFTVDARLGVITVALPLNGVTQSREKRDVMSRLLRRRKRSTTEPLRQDKVRLAIQAGTGLPDSRSSVVVIDCTVNRTCAGCTAPLPVKSGLYGTSLVLVLVFTCLLILVIIIVIILLLVRLRRNKKQQAAREEPASPYNIFPLHSTVASGYQPGMDHTDMDLPPPYTNGGGKHAYINPACSTHQNSDLSHSSGRGSALAGIDDDIDEELHIINSSPYSPNNTSRLQPDSGIQHDETDVDSQSITTHQQYLARLGIDVNRLNSNIEKTQHGSHVMNNLPTKHCRASDGTATSRDRHNTTGSTVVEDPDISSLIHEQLSEIENCSDISRIGVKLNQPVLSSVVNTEEELGGSYNWDYLLDWGPQYQPLAEVFNEIAKLKDEDIQPKRRPTQIVPQARVLPGQKSVKSNFPPPMITDTPPLLMGQPGSSRSSPRSSDVGSGRPTSVSSSVRITPRSPIVHDNSPGVYMPSFTPTLTPLGSSAPLYPTVRNGAPLGTSAPLYPTARNGAPFSKAPQLRLQQPSILPTLSGQSTPTDLPLSSLPTGSQPAYPRTLQAPRPRVPAGKPHYPRPTAAPTMHLSSGSEQEFRI